MQPSNYSMVDIIGVVTSTSPTSTIHQRDGSKTPRKNLNLKDMLGYNIDVSLWGDYYHSKGNKLYELWYSDIPLLLTIKGGRVVEFNEMAIGTISTNNFLINPYDLETWQLQLWFHETNFNASSPSLSRKYNISSRRSHPQWKFSNLTSMQPSEKASWVSIHKTITTINMDDLYFIACPLSFDGMQCMKKVAHHSDDMWLCTKCIGDFLECDYHYILKLNCKTTLASYKMSHLLMMLHPSSWGSQQRIFSYFLLSQMSSKKFVQGFHATISS